MQRHNTMVTVAFVLAIFHVFLITICVSGENFNLQKYLPIAADDINLNANKRFQQIMLGGSPTDIRWNQPKLKVEKIDVKAEIAKLNSTYVYQPEWPKSDIRLGNVSAVSFDKLGNVVIFHRGNHVWTANSFSIQNVYLERHKGPIAQNTILAFDRKEGNLIYGWGKNIFYMPHGLTIDHDDNIWITDVALHQVLKFGPRGSSNRPLLELGVPFVPGNGETKFCKPTSVAVLPNGDFFVADGYCNGRIIKYSKTGQKILIWGQNSFSGNAYDIAPKNFFAIPHALTLVPEEELICAADRENGRVQCFYWTNGTFRSQFHSQIVGDRLFSVDYTPAEGGQLIVVNGPTAEIGVGDSNYNEVRGYVFKMKTKEVVSKFGPNDMQFDNPHDVAVTIDGNEIYVAELNPARIHKFLHKNVAKSVPMSAAKPTNMVIVNSANSSVAISDVLKLSDNGVQTKSKALLVACLMILFVLITFVAALLISRRRKRGKMELKSGSSSGLVYRKLITSSQNVCDEC